MEIVHARCCGLDVHKKSVVASVLISQPDGLIERQVRTFKTMTADLLEMADWLTSLRATHVALESTGVFWRPVFKISMLSRSHGYHAGLGRTRVPALRDGWHPARPSHHPPTSAGQRADRREDAALRPPAGFVMMVTVSVKLAYVAERDEVDAGRLVYFGESLGWRWQWHWLRSTHRLRWSFARRSPR
jgi:hypothetical protein